MEKITILLADDHQLIRDSWKYILETDSRFTVTGTASTGNVTTTGDITSYSVSAFGNFAIGSKSYPLPVIFISFTAHRKEDYTDLRWLTAEEINTDHYEVQRSEDGTGFITLSTVPTTNRLTAQEYSYKDFLALNSIAFYRIRCVEGMAEVNFQKLQQYLIVPIYQIIFKW